jgi:predicted transcriptional regulator
MSEKNEGTSEAWETGALGRSEEHAERSAQPLEEGAIDAAFGLELVTLRVDTEVLQGLKEIARYRGVGHHPLIRQMLRRFVDSEFRQIAQERMREDDTGEVEIEFPTKLAA